MVDETSAIAFAEKILALLGQGRFTATYKYAVLLGLIDLCLEGVSRTGDAPQSVTTTQLAGKVTAMYWPHTVPFGSGAPRVLRQNRGSQAEILALISTFRARHAPDPLAPLVRSRIAAPEAYAALVRDVEWKLVEMPLPRLQRFGVTSDNFIYQIAWDANIRRREFLDETSFANVLHFVGDAARFLVRLAGLLRPLLQRRWASDVARMNPDLIEEAALDDFLFGANRVALAPVLDDLRQLQNGRCFYCEGSLRQPQVDHFIPWARVPMDAIENLVLADAVCNHAKNDHLASAQHVEQWTHRLRAHGTDLLDIARRASWDDARDRVLGIARATYLWLPTTARLWRAPSHFVPADPARLSLALSD